VIILYWVEFAIFLIDKEEKAGIRGLGPMERALIKAVGDIFLKGNFLGWHETVD